MKWLAEEGIAEATFEGVPFLDRPEAARALAATLGRRCAVLARRIGFPVPLAVDLSDLRIRADVQPVFVRACAEHVSAHVSVRAQHAGDGPRPLRPPWPTDTVFSGREDAMRHLAILAPSADRRAAA